MHENKQARLRKRGWKVGSAAEFLGLTEDESAYIDMKLSLGEKLKALNHTSGPICSRT